MLQILNKTDKLKAEWTVRKLAEYCKNNICVFENAVQRGFVWNIEKKSRLIRSTILDRPVPFILTSKHGDIYSNLDGKNRSYTYTSFLEDEFALEGLDSIELRNTETDEIIEYDLNGKIFSELPKEIQNAITDATISVDVINNATEDEECEIFYDINNGQPLNAITATRAKAKSRKVITELGTHELFKNALTAKALEKYTNEDIVVKSWAILNEEEPCLETKHIRPLMAEVEFSDDDQAQLEKCFDRIMEAYTIIDASDKKIAKRLLTRTHMVSIMRVVWKSIQDGKTTAEFAEWFVSFYNGKKSATNDDTYNSYAGSGSAKTSSVKRRLEVLEESYSNFVWRTH